MHIQLQCWLSTWRSIPLPKEWLPRMPSTPPTHQQLFSFPLVSSTNPPYIVNSNLSTFKLFITHTNMFSWFNLYVFLSTKNCFSIWAWIEYTIIFSIEIMEIFFYLITSTQQQGFQDKIKNVLFWSCSGNSICVWWMNRYMHQWKSQEEGVSRWRKRSGTTPYGENA